MESLQDVRNKVEYEGFDYAFRQYSSFEGVIDPEFHRLRQAYRDAASGG
jgi:Zn-finger domain-containing protein